MVDLIENNVFWLDIEPLKGEATKPKNDGIVIIGSGLSGVSVAYWLIQNGLSDITIVDFEVEKSASFRNCGHILYGTVESMKAMCALHGAEIAKKIWDLSISICHDVRDTIARHKIAADYRQDGYYVVSIDKTEDQEIQESVRLLNEMGFQSDYLSPGQVSKLGFKNTFGARFEKGSAQAHPTKFRNELLKYVLKQGVKYHSGVRVTCVEGQGDSAILETNHGRLAFDAAVVAANAYSPLLSSYFATRRLVEPFRGQIITSKPLQHRFAVTQPHSFDHGYEYALVTPDNRLMIGGWRNHTSEGEVGTYDLKPNPLVENGLQNFVKQHYDISETIQWQYSWAGIMAASKTGFPFIGPLNHPRIYACSGYTGHGFSWAHGSAKILADIIVGNPLPDVAKLFRADGLS